MSYNDWLSQQNDIAKMEREQQARTIKDLQDQINYLAYRLEQLTSKGQLL